MKSLIVTYLMTVFGPIISLFQPYYGFLIYVCFAILKPDRLWSWSVPEGNYSRIIAIGMIAGWVLAGFGQWNFGRATPIVLALLGYLGTVFGKTVTSPMPEVSWPICDITAKTVLAFLVGISLIDSWGKLRQLSWVIVLSQGYLAFEFNLMYLAGTFRPETFHHGGIDNNGMALSMVVALGTAWFLCLSAPSIWQRFLAAGSVLLMMHVVLFSGSRGAMLSMGVTWLACFLMIPKSPRHYFLFAIILAILIRLAGPGVQERLSTAFKSKGEGSDGGGGRVDQWNACCRSIVAHPLGVGVGYWPFTSSREYGLPAIAAHSTWLQVCAERGVTSLIFLLGFYLVCMKRLWPYTRDSTPVSHACAHHLARMVLASLSGFLVAAQFITMDRAELPYYCVLMGAGILKLCTGGGRHLQQEGVAPEQPGG